MPSSVPNKLYTSQHGFPTPNSPPDETGCRVFTIPAQEDWFALFMGAFEPFRWVNNFYQNGDMTEQETSDALCAIIDASYIQAATGMCETQVETPFWDEATNVDDDAPADDQIWYGEVEDATAPADSLTWFENTAIWAFTGLLAFSGTPAAAIAFQTVAPKFVLAQRAGDVGEVIRIVVDGGDVATIDTTGRSGEVIETTVVTDPDIDLHQIYVLKVS